MSIIIKAALATLVVCACAACSRPAPTGTPAPEQSTPAAQAAQPPAPDMAAPGGSTIPGKPGAPVTIGFDSAATPQLSLPMQIGVTVRPTASVDRLEVQIGSTEGLSLLRDGIPIASGARAAGETLTESVTVTPTSEGVHYLRVTVITLSGGEERNSVVVFPVQVGAANLRPEGTIKTTPEGERVVEMPAQESGN